MGRIQLRAMGKSEFDVYKAWIWQFFRKELEKNGVLNDTEK
jgi:hypothetical protein